MPFDTCTVNPLSLVQLPNGKSLQVSREMRDILHLLDGHHSLSDLAHQLTRKWGHIVSEPSVVRIIKEKIAPFGVLAGDSGQALPVKPDQPSRSSLALRLKIPLLSEKSLRPFTALGQVLFTKPLPVMWVILALILRIPAYMHLGELFPSFRAAATYGREAILTLFLFLVGTLIHELGHLSACRRYGVRHGKLGCGIYLIYPILYVDVSDSWRLPRWQRVMVDVGGMYFDLVFSTLLCAAFLITRQPAFLFTTVAIDLSFISNLNPMFKWDGYWILSDAMGIPNLHARAGELWKRLLSRSRRRSSQVLLDIQPRIKAALWIYATATSIYFLYVIFLLGRLAPWVLRQYPELAISVFRQVRQSLASHAFLEALQHLGQLLFPTLVLIGLAFLIRGLITPLARRIRNRIQPPVEGRSSKESMVVSAQAKRIEVKP